MWPGAEEWGWTQGRILCSPYFFVKTPGAKDKCIYFTPTSLITLVDKSDCALRKRGLKGIISGKMFSPVRLGIILATMVIFRQNWSLGYDWL